MLVTIDTLRADHVGAYGAAAPTPTLDALAASGVRFELALAPTPLTVPSHASLMTGLDPVAHGVHNNQGFALPEDLPTLAGHMRAAGRTTAAFVGAVVVDRRSGLARGFDRYGDQMGRARRHDEGSPAERPADAVIDEALDWLRTAPESFFLWVHLYDPHAHYAPPAAFALGSGADLYAGEVRFADAQLGRLLAGLRDGGINDDLLVVVTSDHGESLGEHGEATHGLGIYDATQRVPLIMSGAGVPFGAVVDTPVTLTDIAPTLLALVGLDPLPVATGRDLSPALDGRRLPAESVYLETRAPELDWGWSPLFGLRTDRYKLIRAPRSELYDLSQDPAELRNLYLELPQVASALEAELDQRIAGAREAARKALPAAARAQLESLGYVDSVGGAMAREIGRTWAFNPRDRMQLVAAWQEAVQLLNAGRAEEAFAKLEPHRGESPMIAKYRAIAALRTQRLDVAEASARGLVEGRPDDVTARLLLGHVLFASERNEEARAHFVEARRLAPEAAEPAIFLGRVSEDEGDVTAAEQFYRDALLLDQNASEARWRLAALQIEAGRDVAADRLLEKLSQEDLVSLAPTVRLAAAERQRGRQHRAMLLMRTALEADPGRRILLLEYAHLLARRSDMDGALRRREAEHALALSNWALQRVRAADRGYVIELRQTALAVLRGDS